MKLSPGLSLLLLILIGIALSGWLYGIHWKRVASGSRFSAEERLIIQLQDQIRALSEESESLSAKLQEAKADVISSTQQSPTTALPDPDLLTE
tara:strand:- start:1127 stop:1405 length:279 start_codon:yes stop_codon:yes gene_type:complete